MIISFGVLASDSPSIDQKTFITPSPVSADGLAPKAPVKKVCMAWMPLSFLSQKLTLKVVPYSFIAMRVLMMQVSVSLLVYMKM